jgi:hypothetical protein
LVGFTVATASGHLSQSKHSLGIELSKACDRLPQAMPHLIGVDGRQAFQRVEGRLVRFFAQLLESFLNLGYNSLQVWVSKPFRLARHGDERKSYSVAKIDCCGRGGGVPPSNMMSVDV